jgi:hypothetical protein
MPRDLILDTNLSASVREDTENDTTKVHGLPFLV